MFDMNWDGKIDSGEEFMAYQVFENMTESKSPVPMYRGGKRKLDGFEIIIIILLAFQILSWIVDTIY